MSSSAGPSRVSRPRRSSELTSNGSAASSTGTGDGARIGGSAEILGVGDCEVMAGYLGSARVNRNPRSGAKIISAVVPAKAGTHTPRVSNWNETLQQSLKTREHGGYGSPPSRGRQIILALRGDDEVHATLSKHHARKPFWACRRFSASSNTTDCGPSITSVVTSSPRCAGRQCMNSASGFASAISLVLT